MIEYTTPIAPGQFPAPKAWKTRRSKTESQSMEPTYADRFGTDPIKENASLKAQIRSLEGERDELKKRAGLVDRVEAKLKSFRETEAVQGGPDYRALAVDIVRVFHEFVGDELKRPDQYDSEQPGKGQGWE